MDRNSKFSLNSTLLYNLSTHCGHHQFSTFVHKPDQQKGAATMTRSMHILQASQLKTSSVTADFPPSFTSRSIYKFINLHLPRLVKEKKKKRSNKSVLAQIHFTYLSIPEIPMLGQNSLLCPTHPVKRKTKSKREIQRLESHPSDGAFSSYKKKMGNHIPT